MSVSSLNLSRMMRDIGAKKFLYSSGKSTHFFTKPLCYLEPLQAYADITPYARFHPIVKVGGLLILSAVVLRDDRAPAEEM